MSTWAEIKFKGAIEDEPVFCEVWASQFDWRFRYPGADERFGTADDFETPYELVVPDDQKIVMNMRSRDVLHSFFVPKLRLKQDAVPGMTIPIWFEVDTAQLAEEPSNSFDIICTELCGWGHYKMSGACASFRAMSTTPGSRTRSPTASTTEWSCSNECAHDDRPQAGPR